MLTETKRLRISGHGKRLRLRARGDWEHGPLDGIRECLRASTAIDKALGESIRRARAEGYSWTEVAQALGAAPQAKNGTEVIDALASAKRHVWARFFLKGEEAAE